MDLTTATPVEIDTELAELYYEQAKFVGYLHDAKLRLKDAERKGWERQTADYQEQIDRYAEKLRELAVKVEPFEDEFVRRQGWNRYFLVNNNSGHVHRGMDCTTCFWNTQYLWLVELADCDEAAMVAEYGETACTVCFPDAPSMKGFLDGNSAFAKLVAAAKDERAAAKAERDAKKAAKTLNEKQILHVRPGDRWPDHIETVYAAKAWIKSRIDNAVWYANSANPEDPELVAAGTATLIAALAEKGIDINPQIEKWRKAASKNAR